MTFEARLGRTSIVLSVVAVLLGAYIGFYEQGTLSTGELAARRGRLLTHFVRDRVNRVVLERTEDQGGRVVLERERDDDDELGEWRLVEPVEWPADVDAVDTLLGALEWANARRTLEGIDAEDRARFGFDAPALEASFTAGGQEVPLVFGGEDALESGLYLTLDDPTTAYVVGQDLYEALDHDADHFRDRALLSHFGTSGAVLLAIEDDAGERRIEKRDGRFHLEAPIRGYASEGRVRGMLRALGNIEATRFVTEAPETLAEYGLDAPTRTVRIAKEVPEGDDPDVVLLFGAPCVGHDGEIYARLDEGPVVCLDAESLAPLALGAPELREPRLVSTDDEVLVRMTIEQGGRTLVVNRGDDFNFTLQVDGNDPVPVDEGALADFMRDLRSVRATAFQELTSDPVPDPWLVLSIVGADEEVVDEIRVGPPSATGLVAVRGDEPVYLSLSPEAEAVLTVTSLRFRDRRLIDEDVDEAVSLELVAPGSPLGTQVAVRDGIRWNLSEPFDAPAERSALRDAIRELASLEAVRFVAEAPTPAHGLANPRVTATLRFERSEEGSEDHGHDHGDEDGPEDERAAEREYTLRIGAATDDGAFASFGDDDVVFVVTTAVADALGASLVGRGLMSSELDLLRGITVERDGAVVALTKADDGWHTEDGGTPDVERTRDLADRVAVIRATRVVGYGPAARALAGAAAPRARVTVIRTASAPAPARYTIAIGPEVEAPGSPDSADEAPGSADEAPSVYVWREDLDATFLVPAAAVEAFLTYSP